MRHDEFPSNRSVLSEGLLSDGTSPVVWPWPLIIHQQLSSKEKSFPPSFPRWPQALLLYCRKKLPAAKAPHSQRSTGDGPEMGMVETSHPSDKGLEVGVRHGRANHPSATSPVPLCAECPGHSDRAIPPGPAGVHPCTGRSSTGQNSRGTYR